jgi:hypothetical protein
MRIYLKALYVSIPTIIRSDFGEGKGLQSTARLSFGSRCSRLTQLRLSLLLLHIQ